MESLLQLRNKYKSLVEQASTLAQIPENAVAYCNSLLSSSVNESRQFDELYHQQIASFNNVLNLQVKKISLCKKKESEADDWNLIREKHLAMELEREKNLKKTFDILQRQEKEVKNSVARFEEETKHQNMAEVESKVQVGKEQAGRVKFRDVGNRTKQKGAVEGELESGVIKIVVEKKDENGIRDLAEYQTRWQPDQGRFVPSKQYSPVVMKVMMDFNFHKDLRQLESDLSLLLSAQQ